MKKLAFTQEQKKLYSQILIDLGYDVTYLRMQMETYKILLNIIKFQDEILQGANHLLKFIAYSYQTDVAMNIRRLVDVNPRPECESLYKFLIDLQSCNPSGIQVNELKNDIDSIDGGNNKVLKKILDFTLKNCAHIDRRDRPVNTRHRSLHTGISFDKDVFPVVHQIEGLFKKYYKLVEGKEHDFFREKKLEELITMVKQNIKSTFERICDEKISAKT